MRILWLKSDVLVPLDKGGKLRTWHLMRHLAAHHEITYLSFGDPRQPRCEIDQMKQVATRVEIVPRTDTPKGTCGFVFEAAAHAIDPLPYAISKYRSPAFAKKFDELVAAERFDLIVCDFLFPAVNLPDVLPSPAVIFTHNVEAEIWRRHAETKKGHIARLLYRMQHQRMLRYEGRTLARFDGVLTVSDADRNTFARLYPVTRRRPVHTVPTGVDTDFFRPTPSQEDGQQLVFTGSMDWLPNQDAMLFFCREVLPQIRAAHPAVTLSIVGRAPTPSVQKLASDLGVTVTGRVDDVRPFMRDATVYVVPLRIGGGTRLKIFEAMAMGKAIVSTTIGAEGLPVVHGEHLLLADEPYEFARTVIDLLRNVQLRRTLEANAHRLVVDRYDWSSVAAELEHALLRTVERTHSGSITAEGGLSTAMESAPARETVNYSLGAAQPAAEPTFGKSRS